MLANEMVTVFLCFTIPVLVMNLLFFGIGLSMEPIRYKRVSKIADDEKIEDKNNEGLSEEDLEQRERNVKDLFNQLRDEVDEHQAEVAQKRKELEEEESLIRKERERLLEEVEQQRVDLEKRENDLLEREEVLLAEEDKGKKEKKKDK